MTDTGSGPYQAPGARLAEAEAPARRDSLLRGFAWGIAALVGGVVATVMIAVLLRASGVHSPHGFEIVAAALLAIPGPVVTLGAAWLLRGRWRCALGVALGAASVVLLWIAAGWLFGGRGGEVERTPQPSDLEDELVVDAGARLRGDDLGEA